MSEAEQRYGLRIQEIESKLKALSEQVSGELSEEISELREGNMHFAWMKSDLQRVLEDFRNREIKGEVDDFVADLFGEEDGDAAAEELDEVQVINIGKKEESEVGTAFKAHWIYVSDSTSYSSCDQVTSKDIAETVFLEASQNKIANGVDISNGDLLFLMCRPEIPASGSEETQICTYIGLYLDTAGDQDQEPASATEVLITETLTAGDGEEVTTVASVFVWEECTCEGGDPDGKINVPTVSTTEATSSSGYVISEKTSGSQSSFLALGEHLVKAKVSILSNPNSVSGTSSSLSIKPVKDVTLNSSSIDLFATKCGTLGKEDSSSGSTSSNVLAVSLGSSPEQIDILDGLSSGAPISLGGENVRAFIPLVSIGNAESVVQKTENYAFGIDETTELPIVKTSETVDGLVTDTYTLNLVKQTNYSGITTQEEASSFDIVTHKLDCPDPDDPDDGKVTLPTVSTTSATTSSGYILSESDGGTSSGASFVGLQNPTVTDKVCILSNLNNINSSSSSLSLKPVKDVTLNSSSINLYSTPCGDLSKNTEGSVTVTSNVLAVSLGASSSSFDVLSALSSGNTVSLGGENIKAFIPLVSSENAQLVSEKVDSIAFVPDAETQLPIVKSTETENGVTTNTYTLNLANQTHYSGITTQEQSPTQFDIVTQTLEATDTEVTGFTGSYNELEAFNLFFESEAVPGQDDNDPGGSKYTLYREYITAPNTYNKGRLKTPLGNRQTEQKVAVGEFFVPGAGAIAGNNGVSGSLSLLGSYDVTMDSKFVQKTNEEGQTYQEAVHKIYKTSVTRANISWIDGILTGRGADVKKENVLVGVIRVPEAPDAYKCEYGACVKDPSGEYTDNTCDNQCTEPCVLSYRPSVLYVYVYNESKACWELESEHNVDHSPEAQNSFLTQAYSNFGRLEADCENASDPSDPPVKFYVNNVEVVESETKIIREEPLPYEQLCPAPILPVYEKYVEKAGSQPYTETLDLDFELTTSPHDIIVEFCPGVIPDQLKLVGIGPFPGDSALLLDTDVDTGDLSLHRTNSEAYNHKIYQVTLPADTQQLQITVDHTQKDLGLYSGTGWILGMYSASEWRPMDWDTFFHNEPHDFPERIKWRHNSSCTACEQFELQYPSNFQIDGLPGTHYFDTENECNGSECQHP